MHQLGSRVTHAYGADTDGQLRVTLVSFGFKNGLPVDADMVLDVRFLPNPHWIPELRPQTGLSKPVSEYVLSQNGADAFLRHLQQLFEVVAAGYIQEGKRFATIAIGCTGGKHPAPRSPRSSPGGCARRVRHQGPAPRRRPRMSAPDHSGQPVAHAQHWQWGLRSSLPAVVAFGGGHGLATALTALRRITDQLTAIVTVADDGGSSGRLRAELNCLPPGDLRMALAALCGDDESGRLWADVLQSRFSSSGPLGDHAIGNLLIVGLWERLGDPVAGLDMVARLLGAKGRVLPMAAVPLEIVAEVTGPTRCGRTKSPTSAVRLCGPRRPPRCGPFIWSQDHRRA